MKQTVPQSKADTLITNFVIKEDILSQLLSNRNLKSLQKVSTQIPQSWARRTLGRRIVDAVENRMKAAKEELSEQRFVCTTVDVWSTKHRS